MKQFVQRFRELVTGALSGWDRLRFRGTKRLVANMRGMTRYLRYLGIGFKDFKDFAQAKTDLMRQAIDEQARAIGQPKVYFLNSSKTKKEDRALEIAALHGRTSGLLAVMSCIEPCMSFRIHPNRETKYLDLALEQLKCLHYYHYFRDPKVGLLHVRQQTWFPFTTQICLNGRDWLQHQLDRAGVGYLKRDNCFAKVDDVDAAQRLLNAQVKADWPKLLEAWTAASNPVADRLFREFPLHTYWSLDESEWATDIMFRSVESLAEWTPRFMRHAIEVLRSDDVLRFLSRRGVTEHGVHGKFTGEVLSTLKRRPEGMCAHHRLNRNWIKMYDKQGSVLRVETVINHARDLRTYRRKEGDPTGQPRWLPMRKGVADMPRRAEISQKANERYLDSLANVEGDKTLADLTGSMCALKRWRGRRVRALNPLAAGDVVLLRAVSHGEFLINGFRNRDIRVLLKGDPADPQQQRRDSAAVGRQLRLLRAHSLIRKVSNSHRYYVSKKGRTVIAAILAARDATATQLTGAA